jgi:general secretion pathway protein G
VLRDALKLLQRPRVQTWGGFALGFCIAPIFLLALASIVTFLYEGLDPTGQSGVAIAGARDLVAAVDRYRTRHQRVPDAKQGLAALSPEFLEYVPRDPWGNSYVYENSGVGWADVLSYGADGRPGGTGAGADISGRYGRLGSTPPGWLRSFAAIVFTALPIAAALLAGERRWCATALAGMSAFWAVLLLATINPTPRSMLPWISFAAGLASLVGTIALLRNLPHAPMVTLVAVIVAYVLLQYVVTS